MSGIIFARYPGMELYFGSYQRRSSLRNSNGMLVCFAIPEAGISFKAPFSGEELHTEYASLLTLLEFVELNFKMFRGQPLKIFGANLELVNQVNMKAVCAYEFTELLKKTLDYKDKYNFSLGWVPPNHNPATSSLFD